MITCVYKDRFLDHRDYVSLGNASSKFFSSVFGISRQPGKMI